MSYSVVFSSQTGNTKYIAKRIRRIMGEEGCAFFGSPAEADEGARKADVVFVGSWDDKGSATKDVREFLHALDGARVFLFGTCGFGGSDDYYNQVLSRMREDLPASCELAGSFMCQGKMPAPVRERYVAMLAAADPDSKEAKRAQMFIENYDRALDHPNGDDLRTLDADLREAGLA